MITHPSEGKRLSHIAFIMDGNGRWAKKRGLPREAGHTVGAKVFRRITEYCFRNGIAAVTVYAFSTENWKRPRREVDAIMKILRTYLDMGIREMMADDIRITFLGDKAPFDEETRRLMEKIEAESAGNTYRLNIAVNYGGRAELVHAFNTLAARGITEVSEETITDALYTRGQEDPDLIVRTAGELRLSNFLLWQAAYSEFYFTDVLWPDLAEADIDAAAASFYGRGRRFGGVNEG